MLCIIKGSPAQGLTILALAALLLGACSQDSGDSGPQTEAAGDAHSTTPANQTAARRFDAPPLDMPTDTIVGAAQRNAMRQAYLGTCMSTRSILLTPMPLARSQRPTMPTATPKGSPFVTPLASSCNSASH